MGMIARADRLPHVPVLTPLRWLGAAVALAAAAAVVARARERARQPRLSPMSTEWLQSHAADRFYQTHD